MAVRMGYDVENNSKNLNNWPDATLIFLAAMLIIRTRKYSALDGKEA
jgi:hypothetical protein